MQNKAFYLCAELSKYGRIMESSEVKFGVDIFENSYRLFAEYVLTVEKLGFDSIWAAEAHDLDVLTKLTIAAVKTTKVKLGTIVLVPTLRYPSTLAKTISSLDHVSEGRLILGVGCSDKPSIERRGVPSDKPVTRMLESIKIMKKLWSEPSVDYDGQFYRLKDYSLPIKPIQKPHPPIWIAAFGPCMLKITAKHADGWIGIPVPERYKTLLNEIRQVMKEIGRDPTKFEPAVLAFTSIASDHDTAEEYRMWEAPIVGTPDECTDYIERLVKSGARHFILGVCAPNKKAYLNSLKLYAEKVIPYFRDQQS